MIEVWVDGGTGPGNGMDQTRCYGSYYLKQGRVITQHLREEFPDIRTNNEAEYRALLLALDHVRGPARVYSDSRLVVMQVRGTWKCREPRLERMLAQVRKIVALREIELTMVWVPRAVIVKVLGH